MAILKSVTLPGGHAVEYIQFDRFEYWSKRSRRAHAIFAAWKDQAAAVAWAADPTDPMKQPTLADGVRVEVSGADFDACFPGSIPTSAGAYHALKNFPVCMTHKSDTSTTPSGERLMAGAVDLL